MEYHVIRYLAFLLGAVLALAGGPALAQYTGNMPPGTVLGNNQLTARPAAPVALSAMSGDRLNARDYGVKADGVTSDDLAMKAAIDACNAAPGHTLTLPAGQILMTGAAQVTITGCNLVGAGVAPEGGQLKGTTFLMTSTAVTPFVFGIGGVGLEGINFYYPNQTTGTTVYPPLFTDTVAGVGALHWNNLHILNPYVGFYQSDSSLGLGGWFITNSSMYAIKDMFKFGSAGDYVFFNNVRFNQGAWQSVDQGKPWWTVTSNAVAQVNTIFRFGPITGASSTMNVSNSSAFAWGYGLVLDPDANLAFVNINWAVDGVGTIVDATQGTMNSIIMTCNSCTSGLVTPAGGLLTSSNRTAFKLGSGGNFFLHNSVFNPILGSVFETAGAAIFSNNNSIAFGHSTTVADYYFVNAAGGGSHIDVRDSYISGSPSSTRHHGMNIPTAISGFSIQNNRFLYLNDILNANIGSGSYLFNGNTSEATTGANTIITTGSGQFVYTGNFLDKPPVPTISNCGTGASLGTGSTVSHGFVHIGTTVPTTSCKLSSPFTAGGGATCMFVAQNPAIGVIGADPDASAGPINWTIHSLVDMANTQVFYNCSADR